MVKGKEIVRPPYLNKGDKVAFISPAYWLAEEAILQATEVVRSWGLQPILGKHTNCQEAGAYEGNADERVSDLHWALKQDDVKAIVCSRGGYGSIHLLDRLSLSLFQEHPKWLIGHGDITMLLSAAVAANTMSIHGPMALQLCEDYGDTPILLRDMLFGTLPQYNLPGHELNVPGHAEGILMGGNLSSFSSLAGTKYGLSEENDIILFIEEMEEPLHRIDRMFYMLSVKGVMKRVKGVVLGEFTSIRYDLNFNSVEEMLTHHLEKYNIPVCCGFPVGSNDCLPLIVGAPVTLDVREDGATLAFNMEGRQLPFHINKGTQSLFRGMR